MPDDQQWAPLARLANIIGVIVALAALAMIGRFALLLGQAFQGHPRLGG